MLIQILKSKLKEVIITKSDVKNEGSITLDPDLMDAAKLFPYERVEVNAVNGSARIVTYVLKGKRGSGQVEINGGAANFFKKEDHIHVNCFGFIDEYLLSDFYRRMKGKEDEVKYNTVITDNHNKIIEIK